MKIISIVGARPQFIKEYAVAKHLKKNNQYLLLHTGQHYDFELSQIFFDQLNISKPDYNLEVGSGLQGAQTADMLIKIEKILQKEHPDFVLVYGDTNSTLAGALAAAKLHIPLGHVEAGLRSFDKTMPEEINRILTDHSSDLLFTPTQTAVENLKKENITKGVHLIGDVMVDALQSTLELTKKSTILSEHNLKSKQYYLTTIHRQSNTDHKENLRSILQGLSRLKYPVVFPLHPRTKKYIDTYKLHNEIGGNITLIKPVGYVDFLCLENNAKKILTDSGGIQKEAYILQVPCITLRENTEWVETINDGWNILVGTNTKKIINAVHTFEPVHTQKGFFGDGNAGKHLKTHIDSFFSV